MININNKRLKFKPGKVLSRISLGIVALSGLQGCTTLVYESDESSITTATPTATRTIQRKSSKLVLSDGTVFTSEIVEDTGPLALEKSTQLKAQPKALKVLYKEFEHWEGTPYKFGGESKRGVDCSAFVQQVLDDGFGIEFPRSTFFQVREGVRVGKKDLMPGDLVFFKTTRTDRHVGFYLGKGKFMHASTSRGVIIDDFEDDYWQKRYWTARRVL